MSSTEESTILLDEYFDCIAEMIDDLPDCEEKRQRQNKIEKWRLAYGGRTFTREQFLLEFFGGIENE